MPVSAKPCGTPREELETAYVEEEDVAEKEDCLRARYRW
jgi:hypothetical protein